MDNENRAEAPPRLGPRFRQALDYAATLHETQTRKGGPIPNEFWKSIVSIRALPGVTGPLQFDEKGNIQKFPRVFVIVNGDVVDYEGVVERRRRELIDKLRALERRRREQG